MMRYEVKLGLHIKYVKSLLNAFTVRLMGRASVHDASKLNEPEASLFSKWSPVLSNVEYNSPEYHEALGKMGEALDHHYRFNSHHPEHYENGVDGMSLVDIVEMLCDWRAAHQERHSYDDVAFHASMLSNFERFSISPQLRSILLNTARELDWLHGVNLDREAESGACLLDEFDFGGGE